MDVITVGEMIVEIMRDQVDADLKSEGVFMGPYPSGAPAIMIDAGAQLGLQNGMVGSVGNDDFGDCLLERLGGDGVDLSQVRRQNGQSTGCAFVCYFSDGSRRFIFHIDGSASGNVHPDQEIENYAKQFRHCHLMGCSLCVNESMRQTALLVSRTVKENGGTVSLDPNLRPEILSADASKKWLNEVLSLADIVLPSGDEAMALTSELSDEAACQKLLDMGIKIVVLKKGDQGCRVITTDQNFLSCGFVVTAIDPTGAGDCFDAGFIYGYLTGKSLEESAQLANAMGALGTTRQGPMEGVFPLSDVEAFMHVRT